jgi:hypothetical protein
MGLILFVPEYDVIISTALEAGSFLQDDTPQ